MSRVGLAVVGFLIALLFGSVWGRNEMRAAEKSASTAKIKILTSGDSDLQIRVLAHEEAADDEQDNEDVEDDEPPVKRRDILADAEEADDEQDVDEDGDEDADSYNDLDDGDEESNDIHATRTKRAPLRTVESWDDNVNDEDAPTPADGPAPARRFATPSRVSESDNDDQTQSDTDHGDSDGMESSNDEESDGEAGDSESSDGDPDAGDDANGSRLSAPHALNSHSLEGLRSVLQAAEPTAKQPVETKVPPPSLSRPRAVDVGAPRATRGKADASTSADDSATETQHPPESKPSVQQPLPPVAAPIEFKPARFKGVQPHTTDRSGLRSAWGAPKTIRKIDGGSEMSFKIAPYDQVVVTVEDNLVTSIVIVLEKPTPADTLAAELEFSDTEPATITDAQGETIGQAYPEKGAMFVLAPKSASPLALKVIIDDIDATSFTARANRRLRTRPTRCLDDIEQALAIDAEHGAAWELKARALLQIGRLSEAAKAAQTAINCEPDESAHRLLQAEIQVALMDFSGAAVVAREISETKSASALLRARAELLWGDCLAQSADRDFAEAIQHHQQAIKLAEPIAATGARGIRVAAKQILLEAHLSAAHDIGWGHWQQQDKYAQKWIDKAQAILDDLIGRERLDNELRLHTYQRALTALAGIATPPDAQRLAELAARVGHERLARSKDERLSQILAWELGIAMAAAAEIEHARGRDEKALHYAMMAADQLDAGSPSRSEWPTHDLIVGQTFFRVGELHAITRGDNKQATVWFDRATPLLESPIPDCAANDMGRRGEAFVTMAVSYWSTDRRDEAVRLTRQGVDVLEQGVKFAHVEPEALAVPYANLANMCDEMGQSRESKQFAALAEKAKNTTRR